MRSYTSLVRHEGNNELFFFTELAVIASTAGIPIHLHVEGLRGTGKTTILRSARSLLPQIDRIRGCPFNCDPARPHCPQHNSQVSEFLSGMEMEQVRVPYLEISHSAKIGTVVGTLDLSRLTNTNRPEAAMLPGTLPQAYRGIVLVDEVNRLADTAPELTDILLDAMGTKPGRVQIEENGLPTVSLPLQVSIWATSNPDEDPGSLADIRRQLSDRFDFMIQMGRPKEAQPLLAILRSDGVSGRLLEKDMRADSRLSERLVAMAKQVGQIEIPTLILEALAEIYLKHHFESLRSLEAIKTGAVLAAARRGGSEVTWDDVLTVTPAALRHRLNSEELAAVLQELQRERNIVETPVIAAGSSAAPLPANKGKIPSGAKRGEEDRRVAGWWSRIVAWWNRLLGRRRDNCQRSESQAAAPGRKDNPLGGRRRSGNAKSNPLDMPLVTPPSAARPLLELELCDAISMGEVADGSKE